MKTKTILLLCLLLGIGLLQVSAQTVSSFDKWNGYYIDVPVNCNNADVDRLVGNVTYHLIIFYKEDIPLWCKFQYTGEVTRQKTGEVFKVKDIYEFDPSTLEATGHINLIGDKGSHYIVTYSFDIIKDIFTFVKAVCAGN